MPDSQNLETVYNPKEIEARFATSLEREALVRASIESTAPSFSMVIPPPNITGSLHLGHALNCTLQDILARWKRMCRFNVLWIPGTDHAGIAAQNVVERQLAQEGTGRHQLGRERFVQRVWQWKGQSGGAITQQLRRLGVSCDWSRERFTMDEGLSRAVREVFVRLYEEQLIYRAVRLINWCPRCQTALSDIEVEHEEMEGALYQIKYPLSDDSSQYLVVATTRPETMLGDTAVAVHPDDPRHRHLIGRQLSLPLTHRNIPVVGDPILVELEFGTGAVKITPGHDFNDEKAGKRHQLKTISLLHPDGTFNLTILQSPEGADMADAALMNKLASSTPLQARKGVVEALDKIGSLVEVKPHRHPVGKCYRCRTIVEPFSSLQWFVKVNDPNNSLAQPAIDAVKTKKIRFIPESWEPNYFGWMENIEDWCISRQIWWGHQIPAWYCVGNDQTACTLHCKNPIIAVVPPKECPHCGSHDLRQDPDVLDTWFSSALWPFSTLGWPEKGAEPMLNRFYPTSTLVTSFDILFFWVARMVMMGLHFVKAIPFREVYIHALIRDAEGKKMSKSKGNVIDPLEIVDKYGTDALRFTLAAMASPGRDIRLSEDRIEGYRNFVNKLWNAARFIKMMQPEGIEKNLVDVSAPDTTDARLWITSRLNEAIISVDQSLTNYRFDEAAATLYHFVWHQFCDWYLECAKMDLRDKSRATAVYQTMRDVFGQIIRLLHPFMPFVTEALWSSFPENEGPIVTAHYPKPDTNIDGEIASQVDRYLLTPMSEIRNFRSGMTLAPQEGMMVFIDAEDDQIAHAYRRFFLPYKGLAKIGTLEVGCGITPPPTAATLLLENAKIYIPIPESHVHKEIARLEKDVARVEKEYASLKKNNNNPDFVEKAPKEVVAKLSLHQNEKQEDLVKLDKELQKWRRMIRKR